MPPDDNPYQSPQIADDAPTVPAPDGRLTSPRALNILGAIVGLLAFLSCLTGTPSLMSPLPLLVMIPAFFGIPFFVVAAGAGVLFQGTAVSVVHQPVTNRRLTVWACWLVVICGLHIWLLASGWQYGVRFQGAVHTIIMCLANAVAALVSWALWGLTLRTRRQNHWILFLFSFFAWMSWCGFPWLGEI